jgi:hypothetical protein
MLGCLRRRGARKKPKRLRVLRFRTVGPWLYLGPGRRKVSTARHNVVQHAHKTTWAVGANPLRSCFHGALPTARVPGIKTGQAFVIGKTQGDSTLRKKNGVSRRARRRSRGCARTLFVSFAEVDRRSWLREARSPLRSRSKEGRGARWTGAWPTDVLNRSKSSPLFQAARAYRTKFSTAKLRVVERAVGDEKTDSRQAGCATPRKPARSPSPKKAARLGPEEELLQGKSTGHRMRNRRSRERKKSSTSPVERRRSGPGKASSSHGGGVEAVLASLSESAQRAPRKARAGIEERIATGASEAGRRVRGSVQQAPTVRRRSAEAINARRETRGSPVLVGGIPLKYTPDEESVTMSRKEAGTGAR